jgi:membrane protease YdiL (CAAX protease family)
VAGFLFGMLWLRTRNLLLVALLHGLNDCIPAIAGTVDWMRS